MHFSFLEKLGAALLLTTWLIWGANMAGNLLVSVDQPAHAVATAKAPAQQPASLAASPAAKPAANPAKAGDALALLAAADAKAGEKVFKKCKACHSSGQGGKNKIGPNLWDVVGRAKAGGAGFKYSGALKDKGGEWSYQDLDRFLTKPKDFVPGNKMTFAGLKKAKDRAAVIAFLRSLSASPKPLPK